ncbi:MAG: hypothetical protein JWP11_861 [Frankiales bacterium]|nr:hypothetical protein [Frankiales bacterium]
MALVGTLVSDGLAVDSLRAKQQVARAASAKRAAVDRFRRAVRPIAEAVFDQVQPLLDATTDTLVLGQVGSDVRADVFTRAGVQEGLAAQLAALRRVKPPAAAARAATGLVTALDSLASTAVSVGRTPGAPGTDPGGIDTVLQVQEQLDAAAAYWASALEAAFGTHDVPATPSSKVASRRDAVSRAAWVLAADGACGESISSLAFLAADSRPAPPAITDLGLTLREGVERVLLVKVPSADAALHERLVAAPLRGVLQFLDDTLTAAASAKNGDRASVTRSLAAAKAGRPAFARAASGFRSRGATVCSRLFGSALTARTG